jgi:hypothetical protein
MSNIKFYNLWTRNRPKFIIWFEIIDFQCSELEEDEGSLILTIFNLCWIINPKEE